MGTYLVTGIVKEIAIDKRKIKHLGIKVENIIQQLKDELNIEYYNDNEDEDGYYWKIKPEVLEGDLAAFLDAQFQLCTNKKDSHMQKAIGKIKEIKSAEEIIKLAKSGTLIHFQLINQIIEYIRVIKDNGFDANIPVFYELISYFQDGKIITEGLDNSLRYFEANIRLQKAKFPIVDCVKVMITS